LQIMRDRRQNMLAAIAHALLHQVEGLQRRAHLTRAGHGDRLGIDGERETMRRIGQAAQGHRRQPRHPEGQHRAGDHDQEQIGLVQRIVMRDLKRGQINDDVPLAPGHIETHAPAFDRRLRSLSRNAVARVEHVAETVAGDALHIDMRVLAHPRGQHARQMRLGRGQRRPHHIVAHAVEFTPVEKRLRPLRIAFEMGGHVGGAFHHPLQLLMLERKDLHMFGHEERDDRGAGDAQHQQQGDPPGQRRPEIAQTPHHDL
jgi:hypothetical protein